MSATRMDVSHWRVDIRPRPGRADPAAAAALATLRDFGLNTVEAVHASRVYLVTLEGGDAQAIQAIAERLLTDAVTETSHVTAEPPTEPSTVRDSSATLPTTAQSSLFEVFPRPGVTDPAAASAMDAMREMGFRPVDVRTGRQFIMQPTMTGNDARRVMRLLANESVEEVICASRPAGPPPRPIAHDNRLRTIVTRDLNDESLTRLSRQGHLFLSLDEMLAIQAHYRSLGRDPTDLELETLAQTWSEHCVHKTLKSAIHYVGEDMPAAGRETLGAMSDIHPRTAHSSTSTATTAASREIRYENLLKDTIARATHELMAKGRGPKCLSVFKDNAGIIAFDDLYGIAFKAETHNRPSAIEPYGGAATGIGGCIRDVMGCGLGAKPIANTDVFCVAPPDWPLDCVPRGIIHPRAVLRGIVAGVRDYGNRMGIPTVNGAVYFEARYLGNPLVFCGCIGLIPRNRIEKAARAGDLIVVVGGRTGRDGIHGATFSSAELTGTHADEFSHAVQIGNAIEEKKVLDVILQARDHRDGCLYTAITDCGAGGLSSAVGEMCAEIGGEVNLEQVPLKYAGLRYDEIWISESQERMLLSVPPENIDTLRRLFLAENVEATTIGRFTASGRLVVRYGEQVVGDMDCEFLHNGLPRAERTARWVRPRQDERPSSRRPGVAGDVLSGAGDCRPRSGECARMLSDLIRRLSNPTIASKEWIIRQYDHEVGGRSVVKPLTANGGPSDAAVVRPRLDSRRGIAIGCGLCPHLSSIDPYWMAVCAIDEAIRNVVCVGGDPLQTAILDNFCWGRTDDPHTLGALVRACQGCHDAAMQYGTPFISGKDSLNNEFALDAADANMVRRATSAMRDKWRGNVDAADPIRNGRLAIPGTLLISAVALVEDVSRCVTMDLKQSDSELILIGSAVDRTRSTPAPAVPCMSTAARTHRVVANLIRSGIVRGAHDLSDGGALVAMAEMALAGQVSCAIECEPFQSLEESGDDFVIGSYIVEVPQDAAGRFKSALGDDVPTIRLGHTQRVEPGGTPILKLTSAQGDSATITLRELRDAWQSVNP